MLTYCCLDEILHFGEREKDVKGTDGGTGWRLGF